MITQDRLRELLRYEPETGSFYRNQRPRHWKRGTRWFDPLGYPQISGYSIIAVDGRNYLAHRLAWFYVHGEWAETIDHKDGDKQNNRLSNLRPATRTQNAQNSGGRRRHKHDLPKGVDYCKGNKRNPFKARAYAEGKPKHLGCFPTPEAAHAAYFAFVVGRFGEFARAAR